MRWWLNTDNQKFSVDNAFVVGMDFSSIDPNIWLIQWTEGKGEIERQDTNGNNLNGLRESFYDISPYVPLFQQFLSKTSGLLINEAKKVQIDLITLLFETKRQLPINYSISTGNYWWDASDATVAAMSAATLPSMLGGTSGSGNSLVAQINTQNQSVVTKVNGQNSSLVTQINGGIDGTSGGLATQINANIVNPGNNGFNQIDANIGGFIAHINQIVLGGWIGYDDYTNTINNRLAMLVRDYASNARFGLGTTGGPVDIAGVPGGYATNPYRMSAVGGTASGITTNPITPSPITPGSGPGAATVQWTPLGQANPVTVTVTEMSEIMTIISNRRTSLLTVKTNKISAVNALMTIAAVIAYDVLAGWPVIPLPPGFKIEAPAAAASGVTIVTTTDAGGGIPEAPSNNVTYGRRNAAWNPALALSGDVLDGGSF